jgi:hypothetical protein
MLHDAPMSRPTTGSQDHSPDEQLLAVADAAQAVEGAGASLRRHRLPRVLHDSPAAVLLVEADTGSVVQANAAGRALTPAWAPCRRSWPTGAALRRCAARTGPASARVKVRGAGGARQAVDGEPVLRRRDQDDALIWVTGFPIPDAAGRPSGQALLAFLEVDTGDDDIGQVRDRAVVAAGMASPSATRAGPTTRWCSSTRASSGPPATRANEGSGATAASCRARTTDPPTCSGSARRCSRSSRTVTAAQLPQGTAPAFWNELSLSPVYDATATDALRRHPGRRHGRCWPSRSASGTWAAERAARADAERGPAPAGPARRRPPRCSPPRWTSDESLDRLTSWSSR